MSGSMSGSMRLPGPPSRKAVEKYAAVVAPLLREEFGFATLVPWGSPQRPDNLIAADHLTDGYWSVDETESLMSRFSTLLVPCTFETQFEKKALGKLLERLRRVGSELFVLVLQLMEVPGELSRNYLRVLMARHEQLLSAGVCGVLLDPGEDPARLCQKVELEREWFDANAKRAESLLESCEEEGLQNIVESHRQLLWEGLPKALMPGFAQIDHELVETINRVGEYQLIHKFKTVAGKVLLAMHSDRQRAVIKVYDKAAYVSAGDLECMYREFRILRDMVRHPHIIRCHSMMHSVSRVYFVLEFGGMKNLHQHLLDLPGYRLDLEAAMQCVSQLAQALAFCHSKDIVHRQVSLKHVVLEDASERPHCRLVDFLQATHCPEPVLSATVCGDLPCIAPEVVLEGSYLPRAADCWSLGVVLLEAAGGLGSLMQMVGWQENEENLQSAATGVTSFFAEEGSHARALAAMGGVRSEAALSHLRALLNLEPRQRATMASIAKPPCGGRGGAHTGAEEA